MRLFIRLSVQIVILVTVASCGSDASALNGDDVITRAQQTWRGDWHAVWQVQWQGAPVRGPLVAEMWHADDGRMRIETLEASSPALSGVILVDDGQTFWLYDVRQDLRQPQIQEPARIPLASDALDAIDWLFLQMDKAVVDVSGRDVLESGPAIRLDVALPAGDRATLWVHDETGLPSRVELRSETWGEASLATRSISIPDHLHPGLFAPPQED
jgi:outer membrane lipoprotein-sorting protein